MSAQYSKSESSLLEVAMAVLHSLFSPLPSCLWIPELPKALEEEPAYVWSRTCAFTTAHLYRAMCSCFFSLPSPSCSLRAWFRRASFVPTALTTSLSPWSGGSRRRRPAGGHTWCTAGKSSKSGRSLLGTFTMKVGRGQGPELCFHSYLWGVLG